MLITRKIGKILRGNATTYQILTASVLGAILGFAPSFSRAPGLTVFCILLLIILNTNLGVSLLIFGFSRILSYLAVPLVFKTGVIAVENANWIFSFLINKPVLALFGFEYYLTDGGIIFGIITGLLWGFLIAFAVKKYRQHMVKNENKGKTQSFFNSKLGKATLFLLFGSEKDTDYRKALEKKSFPFRIWGIVVAVTFIGLLAIAQSFFAGNFIKKQIKFLLEEANGATVDIGRAYLNLKEGKFVIKGLALCDPENPGKNLFEAEKIVADISALKLLSKRIHFDRVEIKGARIGSKRKKKGKVFRKIKIEEETKKSDKKTLEYYVSNAREIKRKLKKIKRWYQVISKQQRHFHMFYYTETWEEKLEREAKELGYQNVRAKHLVKKSPMLVISNLEANKVKTYGFFKDETLDITVKNISTDPQIMKNPPEILIKSSGNTLFFKSVLGFLQFKFGINTLKFKINKVKTEKMLKIIKLKNKDIVKGGTITIKGEGDIFQEKDIELFLRNSIILENSTVSIPEFGTHKVKQLTLFFTIKGEMDNPSVKIYTEKTFKELREIIKNELKNKLDEKKKKVKEKYLKKLDKKLKKKKSKWKLII